MIECVYELSGCGFECSCSQIKGEQQLKYLTELVEFTSAKSDRAYAK